MKKPEIKKLYITRPYAHARFHVFGEDHKSLCGKAMMLTVKKDLCEPVTGSEAYAKNQDCKDCFRRAGLKVD